MQLIRSENPLDAAADYKNWKAGLLSDDQYYARMALRSIPPIVPDAPGYRTAARRAAAKTGENRLTVPELIHLERTKGDSDELR